MSLRFASASASPSGTSARLGARTAKRTTPRIASTTLIAVGTISSLHPIGALILVQRGEAILSTFVALFAGLLALMCGLAFGFSRWSGMVSIWPRRALETYSDQAISLSIGRIGCAMHCRRLGNEWSTVALWKSGDRSLADGRRVSIWPARSACVDRWRHRRDSDLSPVRRDEAATTPLVKVVLPTSVTLRGRTGFPWRALGAHCVACYRTVSYIQASGGQADVALPCFCGSASGCSVRFFRSVLYEFYRV